MKIMDFINYLNYCRDILHSEQEAVDFIMKVINYPSEDVKYWVKTYWKKANFGRKVYNTYIQDTDVLYDRIRNSEVKVEIVYKVSYPIAA